MMSSFVYENETGNLSLRFTEEVTPGHSSGVD